MGFLNSENGAVTVDWVVLTAGLVGLGLAAMAVVSDGVEDLSTDTSNQLQDGNIIQTAFEQPVTALGRPFNLEGFTMVTPGSCDGDTCTPDIYVETMPFAMSNGEVWTRQTTANNVNMTNGDVVWSNAENEVVDGPDLADDYETAVIAEEDLPD